MSDGADAMPAAEEPSRSVRPRSRRGRARRRTRWWLWALAALLVLLIAAGAWVVTRGLQARSELLAAVPLAQELKRQVAALDFQGGQSTLERAQGHVDEAVALTSDPVWRAAELVPLVGSNLSAVRELADVTGVVLDDVVSPALDAAAALDPATLRPVNGVIDLAPITASVDAIVRAESAFSAARDRAANVDVRFALPQVADAKSRLTALFDSVAPELETAAEVVPLVPDLLGDSAPRRYVLMFMNSAESRALGGTALSFVEITLDGGAIDIGDPVPAGFGNFDRYAPGELLPVPEGADALYQPGSFGTFVPNATQRPDFETAARLVAENWSRNVGGTVDMVVGIDPTALSYAMTGLAPVTLSDGSLLDSTTAVPLLLNALYLKYPDEFFLQDALYAEAVQSIAGRIVAGEFEPQPLLDGLVRASEEDRLLMWSADPEEQAAFVTAGVTRSLPAVSEDGEAEIAVSIHENVGSKLSYYLGGAIDLSPIDCASNPLAYRLTVRLENGAPTENTLSLGPSVLGNYRFEGVEPGAQRTLVFAHAPLGFEFANPTVNGSPAATAGQKDGESVATRFTVTTPPGATSTLTLDVIATNEARRISLVETPMVRPLAVNVTGC